MAIAGMARSYREQRLEDSAPRKGCVSLPMHVYFVTSTIEEDSRYLNIDFLYDRSKVWLNGFLLPPELCSPHR